MCRLLLTCGSFCQAMQLFIQGASQAVIDVSDNTSVQDLKEMIGLFKNCLRLALICHRPCRRRAVPCCSGPHSRGGTPCRERHPEHVRDQRLLPPSRRFVVAVPYPALTRTGKVHGSLARAGKVKGQTPKVEKTPKKKSVTGRAKRRLQYSKRFNVTVAPGQKKKGPNCQNVATI
jgi:small subunit ribosomal protein S30e